MPTPSFFLQELCQRGQRELTETDYLAAERSLMQAEELAWQSRDWDTLSRLYMPLQEARRQKRQLALEGAIQLHLNSEEISAAQLAEKFPQGEIVLAGPGFITPALALRHLASERNLYLEAFLAAAYHIGGQRAIVIVGLEESPLPPMGQITQIDQLIHALPPHGVLMPESELVAMQTPADAVALWQRLHLPYLAAADAEADPIRRMAAYRQVIRVDNACELAHQKLSDIAAKMNTCSV